MLWLGLRRCVRSITRLATIIHFAETRVERLSQVVRLVFGRDRVDFVELEDLAKALGKPLDWFRTK
jgi:hypothetical protein